MWKECNCAFHVWSHVLFDSLERCVVSPARVCYYVIGAIIGKPFHLRPPVLARLLRWPHYQWCCCGPHAEQCTFVHIIYSDNMILPNTGTDYADIWEQRRFCWNSGTDVWWRIFDTWVKMGKSVMTRWGVDKIKIGQKSYLYLRGQQETGSGQAMDMNSFFVFMYILY